MKGNELAENNGNNEEEESVYSVACSTSSEIKQLIEKNKQKSKLKNDSLENKPLNSINDYKNSQNNNSFNDNNFQIQPQIRKKRLSYQYENNILNSNISSSFSINDSGSINNRKGSCYSFNSTKSTLLSKITAKNLQKIKIDIPKKGYLNNRYLFNSKQILTPIEEKDKGTNGCSPSILSCENKKQNMKLEEKGVIFMRQTIDPKIKKFLFSPKKSKNINNNINVNININQNINETNKFNFDKESLASSNSSKSINIKRQLFYNNLRAKKSSGLSENEENEKNLNENINLDDIVINEFNYKTQSKENSKNKKRNNQRHLSSVRSSSSFQIGGNELSSRNTHLCNLRKTPSLNSTLNIKKNLKFDKITKISEIDINNIKQDEIDLNFLKKNLRTIPVKAHKISNPKNHYIKTLLEVQNFFIEDSSIWVMKLSNNFEYLATGSKNGSIKIFTILGYDSEEFELIYNKKNILNYFKLISEKPLLELKKHTKDIIDLSWSPYNYELLLSASLDHYVILWDISKRDNNIIKKFDHKDIITCISFSPTNPNIFISGCFDRFIRIFTINDSIIFKDENNNENISLNYSKATISVNYKFNSNNKGININNNILDDKNFNSPNYFNIGEIITSFSFFPDGNRIAIGTHNGRILVYRIFPTISYSFSFVCRNRLGQFSSGTKVTSINFTDRNRALITTSDSRIRYISMNDGKLLYKYKGHVNIKSMIRTCPDLCNDVLITGSENNCCYIWSLYNKEDKKIKNYKYEYFKPFSRENVYCSLIVPEFCYTNYVKKIYKNTIKINIFSVIINATDNGRLEVLLNVEES